MMAKSDREYWRKCCRKAEAKLDALVVPSKLEKPTAKLSPDWWYRVWYRGFSGRVHRVKGKWRLWNGMSPHHLIYTDEDGKSWGLAPAIARNTVKVEKVRRVRQSER